MPTTGIASMYGIKITLVLEYLIYKKAFGGGDFNIAMAISVVLLAIAAILIVIHQIVMRKEE